MKRLIVNADDFGFNRAITDGIVEAHQQGVVTSTTLMANMPAVEYAVERSADCPEMSVGLHINLTLGCPVSDAREVPSLVQADGQFLDRATFFRRANRYQLNSAELRTEIRNQLRRVMDLGLQPTHADSHHHSTSCVQPFFSMLRVLREEGISKVRTHSGWYRRDLRASNQLGNLIATLAKNLRSPQRIYYEAQHFVGRVRRFKMPGERLIFAKIVSSRKMGFNMASAPSYVAALCRRVTELSCHPGYFSEDPMDNDKMRNSRPQELAFLTDPAFRRLLDDHGVALISFREL